MEKKLITELTDQELEEELKKRKKERIIVAAMMGFLVGAAVWSATHTKGFRTFLILALFFFVGKQYSGKVEEITNEINARKIL